MALLKILKYPDPFLKTKAKPVEKIDPSIAEIAQNMLETMYADTGVGLAATQVGLGLRIFVMDCSETHDHPMVFINPEITEKLEEVEAEEGCLSFPGIYANVKRARKVTIQALNTQGEIFTETYSGLEARCVQHELDHLNGVVFLDYLAPVKRKMLEKKLQKFQKRTL